MWVTISRIIFMFYLINCTLTEKLRQKAETIYRWKDHFKNNLVIRSFIYAHFQSTYSLTQRLGFFKNVLELTDERSH